MRSHRGIRCLPIVLAALAAPGVSAAQPRGVAPAERSFDPATVTTVEGEIREIQRIPRGRGYGGVHVILSTGTDTVDVHLGPDSYVDQQKLKLAKGDRVEVTGSRVTLDGGTAIIAQEVRRGDERLALRDADGVPAWSRRRR